MQQSRPDAVRSYSRYCRRDVREDKDVSFASNGGVGSLQLANFRCNGGIKLQFTVNLQFGMCFLNAQGGVAHLINGLALAGALVE